MIIIIFFHGYKKCQKPIEMVTMAYLRQRDCFMGVCLLSGVRLFIASHGEEHRATKILEDAPMYSQSV